MFSVSGEHRLGNSRPAGPGHRLQHIPVMGRRNGNGPFLRVGCSRLQNCRNGIEHMYPPSDQSSTDRCKLRIDFRLLPVENPQSSLRQGTHLLLARQAENRSQVPHIVRNGLVNRSE